jgi:predicted oxidoreductase (fatty acid repression mutant protein)
MLKRSSAFNSQGPRVIIVVVRVKAVKIYVAVVEALMKKDRGDETQLTNKIGGKISLGPIYFLL